MQQTIASGLSTVVDRTYIVDDPSAFYLRTAGLLTELDFAVQLTEPLLDRKASAGFKAGLRGERDVVVDAMRRLMGKWLVIGAIFMTFLTLWAMVSGEERYWVLDWVLTAEVLMGGFGLMQLRNPADRRRTVVDIAMTGQAGGLHVVVQEGLGKVEDDMIFKWLPDEPVAVKAYEIDALATDTQQVRGSA